jgi:hypothetical protein
VSTDPVQGCGAPTCGLKVTLLCWPTMGSYFRSGAAARKTSLSKLCRLLNKECEVYVNNSVRRTCFVDIQRYNISYYLRHFSRV